MPGCGKTRVGKRLAALLGREHIDIDHVLEDELQTTCAEYICATEQNIVLIGMPGCGKTRVGKRLAALLGREHIEIDHVLEDELQSTCAEYICQHGEAAFRECETVVLRRMASRSGLVISCGGGVVTRAAN